VHQDLAIKCGLSKGPSMPYYKYEWQSLLQNSSYKLSNDRFIITDRTIHDIDRTWWYMAEPSHLTDVAIPNSHNLHSTSLRSYTSIQTWNKNL
jgi:hypothetical protein